MAPIHARGMRSAYRGAPRKRRRLARMPNQATKATSPAAKAISATRSSHASAGTSPGPQADAHDGERDEAAEEGLDRGGGNVERDDPGLGFGDAPESEGSGDGEPGGRGAHEEGLGIDVDRAGKGNAPGEDGEARGPGEEHGSACVGEDADRVVPDLSRRKEDGARTKERRDYHADARGERGAAIEADQELEGERDDEGGDEPEELEAAVSLHAGGPAAAAEAGPGGSEDAEDEPGDDSDHGGGGHPDGEHPGVTRQCGGVDGRGAADERDAEVRRVSHLP